MTKENYSVQDYQKVLDAIKVVGITKEVCRSYVEKLRTSGNGYKGIESYLLSYMNIFDHSGVDSLTPKQIKFINSYINDMGILADDCLKFKQVCLKMLTFYDQGYKFSTLRSPESDKENSFKFNSAGFVAYKFSKSKKSYVFKFVFSGDKLFSSQDNNKIAISLSQIKFKGFPLGHSKARSGVKYAILKDINDKNNNILTFEYIKKAKQFVSYPIKANHSGILISYAKVKDIYSLNLTDMSDSHSTFFKMDIAEGQSKKMSKLTLKVSIYHRTSAWLGLSTDDKTIMKGAFCPISLVATNVSGQKIVLPTSFQK